MPTKEDLKKSILALEPNNRVVNMIRVTNQALQQELVEAQHRNKQRLETLTADGKPCTVRFRTEETGYTWRLESEDYLSEIFYGPDLPAIGTRAIDDEDEAIVVIEALAGLAIRASDLPVRETFDPRRIYAMKNGGLEITFKRADPESGKSVVWSFKQNMEVILGHNTELTRTDRQATATAAGHRRMSQKVLAAYLIATKPDITPTELTAILRAEFPLARVDARHGPHYISLSRNGKLPEASDTDPRTWSKQ